MKYLLILFLSISLLCNAQQTITFNSVDGLTVTADLYLKDKSLPFVILLHQAECSRGEYRDIAPRLLKLGFNCLAVDLRSGKESNYVQNETAALATEKNLPHSYADAEKDINAAIAYVKKQNKLKIILFGSSYSASLALKMAKSNPDVQCVVAFSPGEYFEPKLKIRTALAKYDKLIFVATSRSEESYVKEMLTGVNDNLVSWWKPSKSDGVQGSKMLWKDSPENDNCWMSLLMFFKNMKKMYPEVTF